MHVHIVLIPAPLFIYIHLSKFYADIQHIYGNFQKRTDEIYTHKKTIFTYNSECRYRFQMLVHQ